MYRRTGDYFTLLSKSRELVETHKISKGDCMEVVVFEAVKNQLSDRGYLADQLEHGAWDTYENWKDRGRQVARGQKGIKVTLTERTQRINKDSGDVIKEWERDFYMDVWHHSKTTKIDRARHLEINGDFDVRNGNTEYGLERPKFQNNDDTTVMAKTEDDQGDSSEELFKDFK